MERPKRSSATNRPVRASVNHINHPTPDRPRPKLIRVPGSITSCLHYKRADSGHSDREEIRWYYLGSITVAFMQVFIRGTHKSGNFAVFLNSGRGNGGDWFKEESQAHDFIREQLGDGE